MGGGGDPDLDACGGGGGQDALLSSHQPVLAVLVLLRRHLFPVPLLQPRHKLLVLAQRHLAVRLQTQARGEKRHCHPFKISCLLLIKSLLTSQNETSFVNHNLVVSGPLATPGGETANTGQGREMSLPTRQNQSSVVNHITADSSKSVIFC